MGSDTTSRNTGEVNVEKTSPTDKGCHCFKTGVRGSHRGNGPSHGESGAPESPGVYFGLLLKESNRTTSSHREEKPVGISRTRDRIDGKLIRLKRALPTFAQSFRIEARTLGRIDLSPVGPPLILRVNVGFERSTKPVDVDGREALFGKIMTSLSIGTLSPAVTPNKGRILLPILREAIVGRKVGFAPLEDAHFECEQTRDHPVFLPFLMNFDIKWLCPGIIPLPEFSRRLGHLIRTGERSKSVLAPEGEGEKDRPQKERNSVLEHAFFYVWNAPRCSSLFSHPM